jgi:predicted dehydrogenase
MEHDTRTIKWGILGTGAAAYRFADGMQHVSHATISVVWGRNRTASDLFASIYGALACDDLEQLLSSDVDAVYVATLPDSHADYSLKALWAGKHVLCEKPVALNGAELEQMLQSARVRKLLFMEAMKPPFFPLYRKLQQHLVERPIGEVKFVRAGYSTSTVPHGHPSWRPELGGGSLMGIGVYQAFLAVDWMGAVYEVQAFGRVNAERLDTFAGVQTEHARGIAQLFSGLDLSSPGDAVLSGPEGHVTIHENWWNPVRATIRYKSGSIEELNEAMVGSGFNYETEHFCDLIRKGISESPVMSHEKSRQVMHILDRVRRSLKVTFPSEC